MHSGPLNLIDLLNEIVKPTRNFAWRSALPLDLPISVPDWANSLSIHITIPPNIPIPLHVQPLLLPPFPDLLCEQALILAIIPFRQVARDLKVVLMLLQSLHAIEENVESLDRTLTWGNENARELGCVKQFSGAYE